MTEFSCDLVLVFDMTLLFSSGLEQKQSQELNLDKQHQPVLLLLVSTKTALKRLLETGCPRI